MEGGRVLALLSECPPPQCQGHNLKYPQAHNGNEQSGLSEKSENKKSNECGAARTHRRETMEPVWLHIYTQVCVASKFSKTFAQGAGHAMKQDKLHQSTNSQEFRCKLFHVPN